MDAPPAPAAATEAAATDRVAESPLLQCFALLNDDVLAAYLVPRLVEHGSAGAVALTCSQLRKLCHHSIQHVDLSKLRAAVSPCRTSAFAEELVAAFPHCSSLKFAVDSERMLQVYHSIRPMLAGLSNLSTISIKHDTAGSHDTELDAVLDPMLCQLHTHATGMRSLSLQLDSTWVGLADLGWATLGKMTNLTQLQVTFKDEETHPCTLTDLQQLTGLTNLQSLIIKAPGVEMQDLDPVDQDAALQLAAKQFPGKLVSLTELLLPLGVLHDISSISECVRLRDLQLRACDTQWLEWGPDEWAALAQLTLLTRLHVALSLAEQDVEDADAFYGVLRQLNELRVVGVYSWVSSSLPVLQTLTQLTAICGSWFVEDPTIDFSRLACAHITKLGEAVCAPFQAFPSLVYVSLYHARIADFTALSRYCTALQKLVLLEPIAWVSGDGEVERISAFRSLAHLQQLTHLDLAPMSDAELVAFTSAAAAVSTSQLRCLHVYGFGATSMHALMQLSSVRGMQQLRVHVIDIESVRGTFTVEAVRMWLIGLAAVPKVCLVVGSVELHGVVDAARQWAAEKNMPLPEVLEVSRG